MTEKSELAERDDVGDLEMESWGSRDNVGAMGKRLRAMLPNVKNEAESYRLAQASVLARANPFRGELYIFGDNVVEGYKLLVRWAKRQEDYTATYTKMAPDDPQMLQVKEAEIGYVCDIMRESTRSGLVEACKAGIPYEDARRLYQPEQAVGIVSHSDTYNKAKGYAIDPPKGWSWEQVAKKRALKNALNLAYGMPSPDELVRESWEVDGQRTEAEDWSGVGSLNPGDAGELAKSHALDREHLEALATDPEYAVEFKATVATAAELLYPMAPVVEAQVVDARPATATAKPNWDDVATALLADGPDFEDGSEGQLASTPVPDTKPTRPYDPWTLATIIKHNVEIKTKSGDTLGFRLDNFKRAVVGNLESCFGTNGDQARHLIADYLVGKASSKDWNDAETLALHDWLKATQQDSGAWIVDSMARQEAHAVYTAALTEQGQQTLPL